VNLNCRKVVITGGPSTGKTALINRLIELGYPCFPEYIRELTSEEKSNKNEEDLISNPIVFADDSVDFNARLIAGRLKQYQDADLLSDNVCFFDRGLPDVLAYMEFFNQEFLPEFVDTCKENTYHTVFILPPWEAIFKKDKERFETFEEGQELYKRLIQNYEKFGHTIYAVPKDSVENRILYLLEKLGA